MNSFLDNRPHAARKDGAPRSLRAEPGFHTLIPQGATPIQPKPKGELAGAPTAETEALPQVELVQNGSKVERIIVTCTCCKRIELQCQY
jgi:hypothetical protein